MIDFHLRLLESKACVMIHASAGSGGCLGQAYRALEPEEIEDLERIRRRAESLIQSGAEEGVGRDLDTPAAASPRPERREKELVELGNELFKIIVKEEIREIYENARAVAESSQKNALLLLLTFKALSPLQQIPWEILHDGRRFLAKDSRTAIVRYFEQVPAVSQLEVGPPLRVLLTSANPPGTVPLALDEEEAAIHLGYKEAGSLVDLVVERNVSLEKLEELWRRASSRGRAFHVWHHCGHSRQNGKGEFELCLEEDGGSQPANVGQLQEVVGFCPELRVAIFNVCRGGSTAGVVPALARINVPVVIGFQHPVHDTSALRFAMALHDSLLHIPVEFALSLARKSMNIKGPEVYDWSHAIAFSRRRDRGLLLRKPAEAVAPQKSSKKKVRSQGGIRIDVGDIKGEDIDIIGHQSVGGKPVDSRRTPDIRIKTGDVEGSRIRQIGFQQIDGFSRAEIKAREAKVKDLLEKLDDQLRRD